MLIKHRPRWALPDSAATPEHVLMSRRGLVGTAALVGAGLLSPAALAQRVGDDPTVALYPVKRNDKYKLDREITDESDSGNYNNFIEFGSGKATARRAANLVIRPWTITVDGLVEKPLEIGIDDLVRSMPLEERLYRHRCVETWSFAAPWSGFAFKAFLDRVKPLANAKYVRMETFLDTKMAAGQKSTIYPWPYVEALTMEEAANDLAFLVTGAYGKPLGKQFGAPLRLAVPWKYGFKSIKSIRKFTFVEQRPKSLWEQLQPDEYGFWANVNPDVSHVRWSQASEEILGTGKRVKTLLYNGYAEEVAHLYTGLTKERLFT